MGTVTIEENSALKKFFRANKRHEEYIRMNIQQELPIIMQEKSYKIKTVAGYKYCGKTIYEYKIPLDRNTDCRVAYIHDGEDVRIFFISTTIVKKEFSKLVAKLQGVTGE